MASRQLDEEAIFQIARQLANADARSTYLNQICAGDQALRERVESLLDVHENESNFLKSAEPGPTVALATTTEGVGAQIGRYKLLQKIGEGGFGVVYMAEQQRPVRRKVALKIIKPGMDTHTVVARFEAERQVLALMDHPHIARVLDAGATESGRPYFVMELVKGVPITEYCDANNLTTEDRLKLFAAVCQAVQHAHQKGIIHRDLKPSNILVTLADGQPVVKVIDFGVSKALNQQLTEKTLFTSFGQMIGTPQYMSPEQAEMSCLDVDTRSDIYSLGVLLYELLTGSTPVEAERLRTAGYAEMQRIIREEEPPKPSTRLSTAGEKLTIIARHRRASPERLHRTLQGDLDWLVMKALAKERDRRYATASALEADIDRYLAGDAIEARPPSTLYRLRKSAARHRVALITTAVVMLALLVSTATSGLFAFRESAARADAEAKRMEAENAEQRANLTLSKLHNQLAEKVVLSALGGDRKGAESALKLAAEAKMPIVDCYVLEGIARYHQGENPVARQCLEQALALDANNALALAMLAITYVHTGQWCNYVEKMDRIHRLGPEAGHEDYESLILGYAMLYFDTSRSLAILQRTVDNHPSWLVARSLLGAAKAHLALDETDSEKARRLSADGLRETKLAFQLLPENRLVCMYNLWAHSVAIHFAQQDGKPFEELRSEADAIVETLKKSCRDYTVGAFNIAIYSYTIGTPEAGVAILSTALENTIPNSWTLHLAAFLVEQGQWQKALAILQAKPSGDSGALLAKAYLLVGTPGGRDTAREIAETLIGRSKLIEDRLDAVHVLCLLGDKELAETESRNLLDALPASAEGESSAKWVPQTCLKFHAGNWSIAEFDEACRHSRMERLSFHYAVAMRELSRGNREAAARHFEECTKTGQLDWGSVHWARAFLRLMRDDPLWPRSKAVEATKQ